MSKILIIGAGPCGLGAAFRLKELGFEDFLILEAGDRPGGLATSYLDDQGFTWDVGGHVQFSHYEDFDRVMELVLPEGWIHHQRESWVWIFNCFVPYPLQMNLWRLPSEAQERCIRGLEERTKRQTPKNFSDWTSQSFGSGLTDLFMRPYNFKVWAHPAELMSYQWIGERVATVDLDRVKENIRLKRDDLSWGPNSTFQFPKKGGTGAIWQALAHLIGEDKIVYNKRLEKISPDKKWVKLSNGDQVSYDALLSTIPLDRCMNLAGLKLSGELLSSDSHIVGIGVEGKLQENLRTKCWMYFPEDHTPFYRVTVFSNYSPANVPDPKRHYSLMCETASSKYKKVDEARLTEDTIEGLRAAKLISPSDRIISKWSMVARPGYPTPSLDRDKIVHQALDELKSHSIFSRGRFGAWKYEVSNQDHTFMQGFEWAEAYLKGAEEVTVFSPAQANAPGKRPLR
jgi:protoporphyrinogen oxidase